MFKQKFRILIFEFWICFEFRYSNFGFQGLRMDFQLTAEQKMIQEMARDFTEKQIKPVAARFDEERQFPYKTSRRWPNWA